MIFRSIPAAICAAALVLAGACGGSEPEPEPTATSESPKPELIEYGDGVNIRAKADAAKLTGAPETFKAYMVSEIEEQLTLTRDLAAEGCDEPPTIIVKAVDTRGYASGAYIQCGGAASIWATVGGQWREVWGGQEIPSCEELRRLNIPVGIAGETCRDGKREVPYQP